MYSKGQRAIIAASLGVGYIIYRGTLKQTIFDSHTLPVNTQQLIELRTNQFVMYEGQKALISHPVNKTQRKSRKRIIVIGGGLTGVATSYFLSQKESFDVILIERNGDLAEESTRAHNGCFMPSASYPVVNPTMLRRLLGAMVYSSDWAFSFKSLVTEKFMGTWFVNAVPNLLGFGLMDRQNRMAKLGQLSSDVLKDLSEQIDLVSCNSDNKGTVVLYNKNVDAEAFNNQSIQVLNVGNFDPPLNDKIESGILFPQDSNISAEKLTHTLALMGMEAGVEVLQGIEFLKFLHNKESRKICGVITTSGVILGDEIIVAAGYSSKSILSNLGYRIPLLPLKSYILDFHSSLLKNSLSYNLATEDMSVTLTQLGEMCRLGGCFDVRGGTAEINTNRVDFLIKKLNTILKDVELRDEQPTAGIFSLTPDDVPMVGSLPDFDNIHINAGHGKRGPTSSIGASKLLADSIINTRDQKAKEILEEFAPGRFFV